MSAHDGSAPPTTPVDEPASTFPLLQLVLLLAVWIAISIAGSVVTGLLIRSGIDGQTNKLRTAQSKLTAEAQRTFNGQVAACVRADIQAAKDNRSQYADWKYDRTFVTLVKINNQTRTTKKQQAQARQFLGPLDADIAAKAWVPLIQDCTKTVQKHGANFVLPQPIAFNDTHLHGRPLGQPPASALKVPPPPPLSAPTAGKTG